MKEKEELYEIKEKKETENELIKSIKTFYKIASILFGILACYLAISTLANSKNLILLPFSLCIILAAFSAIARSFNKEFLSNSIGKICIAIFLLMWMGFLGFATYSIGKDGANIFMYGMLTLLWVVGFYMIYKYFIKKNK